MEIVAKFTGPRNRAVVIASVLLVVTCVIWLVIFLQLHSQPRNSVAAAGAKLSSTVDPNSANRRFRRAGASLSVGKGHCQHGSWKFATGYGAKLEDMERKLVEVEKQVLANTQAESDSDVVVSQSDQEKLFEEEVLNEGIRMPTIEAEWEPAPHCVHEVYSAEKAMQCMAQKRRIVWLGDSVLRGMFWDIVELFQNGLSNSKFEVRVDKRYASERFTNFEDEDLIVTDKQTNDEVFSLRFTYVSNAVEFESRCELIHDWFFQCLDDTRTIMDRVIEEELGRKQLKTNAPDDLPIGLLYWNTGLWDWRTGLPTHEYYEAMKSILLNVDPTEEQAKAGWTGYKRASIFDHSREVCPICIVAAGTLGHENHPYENHPHARRLYGEPTQRLGRQSLPPPMSVSSNQIPTLALARSTPMVCWSTIWPFTTLWQRFVLLSHVLLYACRLILECDIATTVC